jgi:D-alanyl-D-alanine endopeptidase (penicillin-binding protein 7)
MLKLALAAAISMMFVLEPAAAATRHKGHATGHATTAKHGKAGPAKIIAHPRGARRVAVLHGRRHIVFQRVRHAAPAVAVLSAGELAGLNRTTDPLELRSNVAYVLDQSSSEVLFEKNAAVALPIASITKLMTGLLVVQAGQDLDEVLTVTEDDVDRHKFTSSRLPVGARMTRGNLLHIALMSSENRAAAALGRNYPGGITAFVEAMNAKARELGMNDTHYVDSSGLSSQNISSARDLAKLVKVAHQEPLLRQYTTDPNYVVQASGRALPRDAGHDPGPQRDHGVPRFEGKTVAHGRRRPHAPLARGAQACYDASLRCDRGAGDRVRCRDNAGGAVRETLLGIKAALR